MAELTKTEMVKTPTVSEVEPAKTETAPIVEVTQ